MTVQFPTTSTPEERKSTLDYLPCEVLSHLLRTVLMTQGPLLLQRLTTSYPLLNRIAQTDRLVYPRTLYLDIRPSPPNVGVCASTSAWTQLAQNLSAVYAIPDSEDEALAGCPVSVQLTPHPMAPSSCMIQAIKPLLTIAGCKVSLDLTLWVDDIRLLAKFLYDLDSTLSAFRLRSNLLTLIHRGAQSPKLAFPWRPHGTWARIGISTWPLSAVLCSLVRPCAGCGEHRVLFSHPHQTSLACSRVNCDSNFDGTDLCNRCRPRTQCWECGQAVQCDKCWLNAGWTTYSPLRSVCTSLTHRTGPASIPWVCQKCVEVVRQEKQKTGRGWVCEFCDVV